MIDLNLIPDTIASIVGISEQEAIGIIKAAGLTYRIASKDGKNYMLTQDIRKDRINLHIANDIVTDRTHRG
jgi:hypothetical protein